MNTRSNSPAGPNKHPADETIYQVADDGLHTVFQEHPQPSNSVPRKTRVKRFIRWLFTFTLVGLVIFGVVFKDHLRSLWSLQRVAGTRMYVMDYYATYNIAGIRKNGVDPNDVERSLVLNLLPQAFVPIADWINGDTRGRWRDTDKACSTVFYQGLNGHVFFGRNFDWQNNPCLIVRTHGANGVATVSVVDLHLLGLSEVDLDHLSLTKRLRLLFAPYIPSDGMNQHGVAVSAMSALQSRADFSGAKPTVVKPLMKRLILDYAHNVDEAVELIRNYRIEFSEAPCHFMIADAQGESVVVEFVDGEMRLVPATAHWQVSTNHLLTDNSEAANDQICWRYRLASDRLAEMSTNNGGLPEVMETMSSISVENWTMWSSVYDLTSGEYQVAYRRRYDVPFRGRVEMQSRTEHFSK